jgi:hypothetical protein
VKKVVVGTIILLALAMQASGQQTRLSLYWTDMTLGYQFSEKVAITGEVGYRFGQELLPKTYYIRPLLQWSPSAIFSYQFGFAVFYLDIPDAADDLELRGHQTMTIKWPQIIGIAFAHRFQLEQRFIKNFATEQTDFVGRGRYRLQISSPDFTLFKIKPKFYGLTNVELLFNLNTSDLTAFVNQDRFMVGLGNRLSSQWKVELHYQLLGSRLNVDEKITIREDVYRLRLFYLINALK